MAGAGSADNASFIIDGNVLKTAAVFNYEAKKSYTIRIRSTDQGGLYVERTKTITITNVNESPTNIGLSNSSVAAKQPVGTTVGTFEHNRPRHRQYVHLYFGGKGRTRTMPSSPLAATCSRRRPSSIMN